MHAPCTRHARTMHAPCTCQEAALQSTQLDAVLGERGEMEAACRELEVRLEAASQQLAEQCTATAAAEQARQASEDQAARWREAEQAATAEAREARHQLEARSLELAHLQGERAAWLQQSKEIETREQRLYELVEATTSASASASAPAPAPASASVHAEAPAPQASVAEYEEEAARDKADAARAAAAIDELDAQLQEAEAGLAASRAELEAEIAAHEATASRLQGQLVTQGAEAAEAAQAAETEKQARSEAEGAARRSEARAADLEELLRATQADVLNAVGEGRQRARQQLDDEATHASRLEEQQELLQRLSARLSSLKQQELDALALGRQPHAAAALQHRSPDTPPSAAGQARALLSAEENAWGRDQAKLAEAEAEAERHTLEAAELRLQLAQLAAEGRAEVHAARAEAFGKERQLEQAQRRWRCHRHDGETKLKLLEEQVSLPPAPIHTRTPPPTFSSLRPPLSGVRPARTRGPSRVHRPPRAPCRCGSSRTNPMCTASSPRSAAASTPPPSARRACARGCARRRRRSARRRSVSAPPSSLHPPRRVAAWPAPR